MRSVRPPASWAGPGESPLTMVRTRVLDAGLEERLELTNFAPEPVTLTIDVRLRADFADVFDVRSVEPHRAAAPRVRVRPREGVLHIMRPREAGAAAPPSGSTPPRRDVPRRRAVHHHARAQIDLDGDDRRLVAPLTSSVEGPGQRRRLAERAAGLLASGVSHPALHLARAGPRLPSGPHRPRLAGDRGRGRPRQPRHRRRPALVHDALRAATRC
ncbi:MAG: glycogen debranching N-terminal domain-containing protein [Actinomycetota bacterium]